MEISAAIEMSCLIPARHFILSGSQSNKEHKAFDLTEIKGFLIDYAQEASDSYYIPFSTL
jgi:hypothetical protein